MENEITCDAEEIVGHAFGILGVWTLETFQGGSMAAAGYLPVVRDARCVTS